MTRIAAYFVCGATVGLLALACTSSSHKRDPSDAGAKSSGANAGESGAGRAASSGGGTGGAGANPSDTQCDTAADCGYGEIDHEIVKKADCVCLFGCPYLPLNKAAIERRKTSYAKLCDPKTDADGKPCPIDDCVPLTAAMCDNHVCRAAPR